MGEILVTTHAMVVESPVHRQVDVVKCSAHAVPKFIDVLHRIAAPIDAVAQSAAAPDSAEPGSAEECQSHDGNLVFSRLGLRIFPHPPQSPPPRFFGTNPGGTGEFVDSAKAYAYSRALGAASPRVRVFTMAAPRRPYISIVIADERASNLDALKSANAALADPRTIDCRFRGGLIAGSRPFYLLNAALHSDETGFHRVGSRTRVPIGVSRSPMIRRIRENLVVLINPVSNPDGRTNR